MGSTRTLDPSQDYRVTGPAVWGLSRIACESIATGDVVRLNSGHIDADGDVLTVDTGHVRASSLTPLTADETSPEPASPIAERVTAAGLAAEILSKGRGSLFSISAAEIVALAKYLAGEEA